MKKSCLTVLLAVMLILALSVSAGAASFNDISGHWAERSIAAWQDAGLFNGYPDGSFRPNDSITRAEFAAVLNRILALSAKGEKSFTDVSKDAWYYQDVTALAEAGIAEGAAFRPTVAITREEAVVMFAKAFGLTAASDKSFTDDGAISAAARVYVQAMVAVGYIQGYPDGSFGPAKPITRAEAVKILDNASVIVKEKLAPPQPTEQKPADSTVQRPSGGSAYHTPRVEPTAVDLDSFTAALPIDYSKPQTQPLSGWFTVAVGSEGRSAKVYIPEYTTLRARFIAIAAPDDVQTWSFLDKQGWLELADGHGECLFVLEPGQGGWGDATEESAYVTAALRIMTSGNNNKKVSVMSNHGGFGFVGYGAGCAPLEGWTVKNPMYAFAQVFIGGKSIGQTLLQTAGAVTYLNVFGGRRVTMDEFEVGLAAMGLSLDNAAKNENIAVPTWLIGYGENDPSTLYWQAANDCLTKPTAGGVYHQSLDSDAWQTLYANQVLRGWGAAYGLSQVRVEPGHSADTEEVFAFLSAYTRYTTACAYSNNLASHMNYDHITRAAYQAAESGPKASYTYTNYDGKETQAQLWALKSGRVSYAGSQVQGTLYAGSLAAQDHSGDGVNDPREFLIYVPDTAADYGKTGAPLVLANPGRLQTAQTFLDCSGWIPVANDEGCIVLFITQPYATATTVAYKLSGILYLGEDPETANFARAMMAFLKQDFAGKKAAIDFTRVYASGHSAGSYASENLALVTDNEWIAAVASTSFFPRAEQMSDGLMPTYLMVGHTDINDNRVDMVRDPYFSAPTDPAATSLNSWLKRVLAVNDISVTFTDDNRDSFIASCSSTDLNNTRYLTYSWANEQGIELVRFGRTLLREHNSYPEECRLAWDFMEHFQVVQQPAGGILRYYSPSGFQTSGDKVELLNK